MKFIVKLFGGKRREEPIEVLRLLEALEPKVMEEFDQKFASYELTEYDPIKIKEKIADKYKRLIVYLKFILRFYEERKAKRGAGRVGVYSKFIINEEDLVVWSGIDGILKMMFDKPEDRLTYFKRYFNVEYLNYGEGERRWRESEKERNKIILYLFDNNVNLPSFFRDTFLRIYRHKFLKSYEEAYRECELMKEEENLAAINLSKFNILINPEEIGIAFGKFFWVLENNLLDELKEINSEEDNAEITEVVREFLELFDALDDRELFNFVRKKV